MKRTVIAGLVAALSVSLAACAPSAGGAPSPSASAAKSYKVGITQIVSHDSLDAAREGFKKAFTDAGLTVTFDEKNANDDQSTNVSIASTLASADLDLILAVSTPSAQALTQVVSSTPVLFTAVTDPVTAGLVTSMDAPGKNVTGTSDMNPVAEQIALIKKIKPDATSVGILYSSGEINSEVQVKAAREAAAKEGLAVTEKAIAETRDVQQALASFDVDALYVPTDNKVVSALGAVIQVAETKKIPLVVGEGDSVRKGGVITYGLDYTRLGHQTGEMAIRILTQGANPATMPVETQKDLTVYVNKAAAQRMGVTIPESLLAGAEIVDSAEAEGTK
ncbi:MAG: ABC transporter substrate-binding protein [Propioniciclava sp.]|uniref:ABC transporter substrate-binding protein n=1 Tax=Propioniciclava sp. TaxID=2038686 RepID=UPI0039E226C3